VSDRRKNTKSKAAAGTEKKDDVVANVGVPHEEKVDLSIYLSVCLSVCLSIYLSIYLILSI
jgi:hypothetical protein